jgi:hypothetical protein
MMLNTEGTCSRGISGRLPDPAFELTKGKQDAGCEKVDYRRPKGRCRTSHRPQDVQQWGMDTEASQ